MGVDFGIFFINIYVNSNGLLELLKLENLYLKVMEVLIEICRFVLFEYFVLESFILIDKLLFLFSVLIIRGKLNKMENLDFLIIDGRIYIFDCNRFELFRGWIEIDLKWKNYYFNKLFLKYLVLYVSVVAVKEGVK